jgi:hypothetical protein
MSRLDFDPDLDRLGDALRAGITTDLAREQQAAHANRPEQRRAGGIGVLRRPRLLAGGTLGLAGVGAALVLALGGTAATAPAYAVTQNSDGSVLVQLNYDTDQNLPQVENKLAAMGIHEVVTIYMARGPAAVNGPVTCAPAPGVSGPPVKVLVGKDGTETIGPGQSGGNTAEGSFHLVRCTTTSDTGSGITGNTGTAG